MKRELLILGIILIAAGAVMVGYTYLAATAIYDSTPPTVVNSFPSSTDSTAPTPIESGKTVYFWVKAYDEIAGIDTDRVYCIIYYGTRSSTTIWKTYNMWEFSRELDPTLGVDVVTMRTDAFTVPSDVYGWKYLPVEFKIYDLNGNIQHHYVYAEIGQPKVIFYINDQEVTEQSIIRLTSPDLRLKLHFEAVYGLPQQVVVKVWYSDKTSAKNSLAKQIQLTWTATDKIDGTSFYRYEGSYTLPSEGWYVIEALALTSAGDWITAARITVTWGVAAEVEWMQYLGWAILGAGIICLVASFMVKEEAPPTGIVVVKG